jgi:hypothetical protein
MLADALHVEAILAQPSYFATPPEENEKKGARQMSTWEKRRVLDGLKLYFSEVRNVFGPAWLVMMADVDAASVITAMQSGASFNMGLS